MKILHTSDWHLGRTLYSRRCAAEFKAFLDWMITTTAQQQADCLLIAGDIFDTSSPGNTMQAMYYSFLHGVSQTCCRHVVIIGGNHDSPSLLDAPRRLLSHLNVTVIGSISDDITEEVVTIAGDKGKCIVCAVPFLRDRDIRKAEPGESIEDKARKLVEGIRDHYHQVAAIAQQQRQQMGDDIPLVAMGHLFAAGGKVSENNEVRDLYVGSLAHFHSSLFPDCIDYLALGHLHIAQRVQQKDHIRYSGSPLQLSFGQDNAQKSITAITFTGRTAQIELVPVPAFLRLETLKGDSAEIMSGLKDLLAQNCSIMLEVIYTGDNISGLQEELEHELQDTGIELLRTVNRGVSALSLQQISPQETLEDLTEMDVFRRCLDAHDIVLEKRAELEFCFSEILQSLGEDEEEGEQQA